MKKTQHRSRGHVQMDSEQFCKEASNGGVALSGDVKPRLKWTQQLHQLFLDSVSQLGGVDSKLKSVYYFCVKIFPVSRDYSLFLQSQKPHLNL